MTHDKYDALERFTPLFEPPPHSFERFLRQRKRKRRRRRVATGVTGAALVGALVATFATVLPHRGASTGTVPVTTIGETPSVATALETSATTPDAAGIGILPPDEGWGGLTRGDMAALWWQRLLSMPEVINPYFDSTGERCGYQQSGPVFILPGNFAGGVVERTCVVAEGTAIFVYVAGATCSTIEPPPYFGRTEEELRACATATFDRETSDFQAGVDGQEVADLADYRITSPMFTITIPEDAVFGMEPGVGQAVAAAYGFIIAPPPPGQYEITASQTVVGAEPGGITTTIIVEAPQVTEPPTTT